MKAVHPALKILTASLFVVLMSGFVALKSGAFDSRAATIKLFIRIASRSHHRKNSAKEVIQKSQRVHAAPVVYEIDQMIASSKTVVVAPFSWGAVPTVYGISSGAMMSSSKSAPVVDQTALFSVYKGIFSTPYGWKAKSKGEQLKQGNK